MAENTLPFRFKWVSTSPDPHNKTMRNNLEPQEIIVEIEVPVKHEYIRNSEDIIKEQLGVDVTESTKPILTVEGMRYAIEQLSLREVLEPVEDDVEWDDAETPAETSDDDSWDTDEEEWDADESEDEEDFDIDWDE